jgi:hypothetical protein
MTYPMVILYYLLVEINQPIDIESESIVLKHNIGPEH